MGPAVRPGLRSSVLALATTARRFAEIHSLMALTRRRFTGGCAVGLALRAVGQTATDAARAMWEDVMELLAAHYYEPVVEARLTLLVLNELSRDQKADLRVPSPFPQETNVVRGLFAQEIARLAFLPGRRACVEETTVRAIEILCDKGLRFSSFRSQQAVEAEAYVRTSAQADIGMVNYLDNGRLLCRPFGEGPAWNLGIREGDELLSMDGVSMRGQPLWKAGRLRHGQDGSKCLITVRQSREPHRVISGTIVRRIMTRSPTVSRDPAGVTVRIPTFGNDSTSSPKPELQGGLRQLRQDDLLTLDFRGNSGGSTDNAVEVAGCLLPGPDPRQQPLVIGRRVIRGPLAATYPQDIVTEEPCQSKARRVVILVDGHSASVTELVTLALLECPDLHVTVGGEPTFGKHLLQNTFSLPRVPSLSITFPYGHMTTAKGTTWEHKIIPTFASA